MSLQHCEFASRAPGATILGGVSIRDHVKIGANVVLLDDVPNGATVVDVPARIVFST